MRPHAPLEQTSHPAPPTRECPGARFAPPRSRYLALSTSGAFSGLDRLPCLEAPLGLAAPLP